jgi:hypothetical protein
MICNDRPTFKNGAGWYGHTISDKHKRANDIRLGVVMTVTPLSQFACPHCYKDNKNQRGLTSHIQWCKVAQAVVVAAAAEAEAAV